jgi:beta-galactosidase/beta-glucuronidase
MVDQVYDEYPRPNFQRTSLNWQSLDGAWDFVFDDEDVGLSDEHWLQSGLPSTRCTIKVPFVFQTPASGIDDKGVHEVIWYERSLQDIRTEEERRKGHRLLLRFGAVDYEALVWVDGSFFGSHTGGHVPFDLDITDAFRTTAIPGSVHRLTVRVCDSPTDLTQPRGKQYWAAEPESIWYTPSSGIWQSVFLESVPAVRLGDGSEGTRIFSTNISDGIIDAAVAIVGRKSGHTYRVEIDGSLHGVHAGSISSQVTSLSERIDVKLNVRLGNEQIKKLPQSFLQGHPLEFKSCWRDSVALWSPEFPILYDLTLKLYDDSGMLLDEVTTTTGMRNLDWSRGDGYFRLNDSPYLQCLVLDQGYWPETNMTPPNSESCRRDIEIAKEMGFNGCRKHQKVEDPRFLYWADRLGYIVWGEMVRPLL